MNFKENLAISLSGLNTHRLRSFLTILGIIFGVAAVVSMLSIGAGARKEAMDQIKLLGVNNIILQSEPVVAESDNSGKVIHATGLKMEDARSLLSINPLIEFSGPQKTMKKIRVRKKSEEIETGVVGTIPDYQEVLNYKPFRGNFFNYRDLHEVRRVCVLGSQIKRQLFFFQDPIGEQIKINGIWFTVVGVMEPKPKSTGKGGIGDRDLNTDVYIPLSSLIYRFSHSPSEPEVDQIILKVADKNRIKEATNLTQSLLKIRHKNIKDYRIVVPEELIRQSQKTQHIFNIVMGAIAGISLLVGGIGIMNIMLATVMERTREIGIRRAVGATKKDILGQFLIEAVLLSFTGGLAGVFLGFIMTKIIALYANWTTIVELTSILLAFSVSAAVGIVFGIYPAKKAAVMNPIDSLRYE
jgi:putative ABC transport system permease protein